MQRITLQQLCRLEETGEVAKDFFQAPFLKSQRAGIQHFLQEACIFQTFPVITVLGQYIFQIFGTAKAELGNGDHLFCFTAVLIVIANSSVYRGTLINMQVIEFHEFVTEGAHHA